MSERFMVMLSRLGRFRVVDARNRRARLVDFAIDISVAEHPPVTEFVIAPRDGPSLLVPASALEAIDWRRRELRVDAESGTPATDASLADRVLLARDVLDS